MSSEENQGSEDDTVEFEELPEIDQENPEGTGEAEGASGDEGGEGEIDAAKGGKDYKKPGKGYKYTCPAGQVWDPKVKKCVPIKKGAATYTCPEGEEWDEKAGKCVKKGGQEGFKGKDYTCPANEVWDAGKKKCVPIKEALDERDLRIKELTDIVNNVQVALRLKEIETEVDQQIQAGHLAPVQRDKAVKFMAALPQGNVTDFISILSHQKFPVGEETGRTTSVEPPGAEKKGIGESEEIKDLKPEEKEDLKKRFGIDNLVEERGVKKK